MHHLHHSKLPTRRTPCIAVLEHLNEVERLLPLIKEKIQPQLQKARAGASIWVDAGEASRIRREVEDVARILGILPPE